VGYAGDNFLGHGVEGFDYAVGKYGEGESERGRWGGLGEYEVEGSVLWPLCVMEVVAGDCVRDGAVEGVRGP